MPAINREEWLGYSAAISIVFVWSTWLVVSRFSVGSGLTVYDLTVFRYGVAAIVALPFVIKMRPWRNLSLWRMLVISTILGPIYILFVFAGFHYAPASHGGVFMNGVLPLLGLLIAFFLLGVRPTLAQIIGSVIIFLAAFALAGGGIAGVTGQVWLGDLFFLIGAVFFAFYVALSREWALRTGEILFCGTIINAVIYVPIWVVALPSGIDDAPFWPLLLQIGFQGFVPNLAGLLLIAFAARTIGTVRTSAILAAVPAVGAVFGAVLLNELPTMQGWVAIGFLTFGLLLATLGWRMIGPMRWWRRI